MTWIAERKLIFSPIGSAEKMELVVRISAPFIVNPSSVSFQVTPETAACVVELIGDGLQFSETTYGADSVQALQLAADIDPLLERYSKKYEFYFIDGEPYWG